MNAEFFDAVADIEKEKGIPREYMYEKIRQAMLTAFRKDTPDCEDNVEVILDEAKKEDRDGRQEDGRRARHRPLC